MIRLPHLTWPQRAAVAAGIAVVALVGGLAGPASAHSITGFSEAVACSPTAGLDWTFTSSNAGSHSITTATFNRPTILISQTATTVKVHTAEQPGPTSLSITATFEDGHVSNFTASTVMLDGVCPPPTTTTAVTTSTTTTTPPPPTTTATSAPASVPSTEPPVTSVAGPPISPLPSTGSSPTSTPAISPTHTVNLPATGAGETLLLLVIIGLFLVVVGILLRSAHREHNG